MTGTNAVHVIYYGGIVAAVVVAERTIKGAEMSTCYFSNNAMATVARALIICIGIAFFNSCSGAVTRPEGDAPAHRRI